MVHRFSIKCNVSAEDTVRHSCKGQCTDVLPWHICTVICTHVYIHNGGVRDSELPTQLCPSSSNLVSWGWQFRDCNHHLSPAVTRLVDSRLCVLNQCCKCVCVWGVHNCYTFLCEHLFACLIDWLLAASAVIEQHNESLQTDSRLWRQPRHRHYSDVIKGSSSPCILRRPLAPATKRWHHVTS